MRRERGAKHKRSPSTKHIAAMQIRKISIFKNETPNAGTQLHWKSTKKNETKLLFNISDSFFSVDWSRVGVQTWLWFTKINDQWCIERVDITVVTVPCIILYKTNQVNTNARFRLTYCRVNCNCMVQKQQHIKLLSSALKLAEAYGLTMECTMYNQQMSTWAV